MTSFEGSDQVPSCFTDPMAGSLKMALCPAKIDDGDSSLAKENGDGDGDGINVDDSDVTIDMNGDNGADNGTESGGVTVLFPIISMARLSVAVALLLLLGV